MRPVTDRNPASFLRRAGAYVIDIVAIGLIWFGSAIVVAIPGSRPEEGLNEPWETFVYSIVYALPAYWFVYHWVSNAIGVSIGKLIVGISIEPPITAPSPIVRGLIRTIGEVISALTLGLGYFWALWDRDNRTWHDRMAGTRVVSGRSAPVPRPVRAESEPPSPRRSSKNLRFACAPPSPAAGVRWVELRREGIRFEDEHGLRGLRYEDVHAAQVHPSGEVELRYIGRDVFGRPAEQSVRLAVKDRDAFLKELESRVNAATGTSLTIARAQA